MVRHKQKRQNNGNFFLFSNFSRNLFFDFSPIPPSNIFLRYKKKKKNFFLRKPCVRWSRFAFCVWCHDKTPPALWRKTFIYFFTGSSSSYEKFHCANVIIFSRFIFTEIKTENKTWVDDRWMRMIRMQKERERETKNWQIDE